MEKKEIEDLKKMGDSEDLSIIFSLYNGNHLSNNDLERASKLIYLFKQEILKRIK